MRLRMSLPGMRAAAPGALLTALYSHLRPRFLPCRSSERLAAALAPFRLAESESDTTGEDDDRWDHPLRLILPHGALI